MVGAGLAAAFSLRALDSAFERITTMESNLLKTASRLNTTTETLSSFSVMARKTGMDNEAFIMTLTRMDKSLSAAALGAEQATGKFDENGEEIAKVAKGYDELGIKASELQKLPLDQRLLAMAEAFQKNVAPADQVRVAMEIGGKGAAGMVNIFREGPEAMQKWIDRATELGLITTDMAKRGAEAKSAAADLSLAWESFARTLVDAVAPAVTTVLNLLTELILKAPSAVQAAASMHSEGSFEPIGEAVAKPHGVTGTWTPESIFKPPVRTPEGAGKGGGGSKDTGLDRMQSIIDTLQKDLSRLTEGSLAEITSWGVKMRNEIEKVGKKGADTERALALTAEVEAGKKKKATEDYELFVAKESGDTYMQIEADAKSWLEKYKGFAGAEENIASIKARKIWEADVANYEKRLNMQKSIYDSLAQESPLLSQQLAWKQKILPIELELNRLALERMISENKIEKTQADELRGLNALANQAKKFNLEREGWKKEGWGGGLRIGAEDMKAQAETWAADQTAALMKSMPQQVSSTMASSFIGFLQGRQQDFVQMGWTMAESMIQKLLEGIMVQIIPAIVNGLSDALSGLGGGGGGGIGGFLGDIPVVGDLVDTVGGFFGFHDGGLIRAHSGLNLKSDEVPIIAQTGERVLSRQQNRDYEAGLAGGGSNVVHAPISITINPRHEMTQADYDRHARMIKNSLNKHLGVRGSGQRLGDGRY